MQAERLAILRVCVLGLALLVSSAGLGLADEPRLPREPVARMSILPDRVEWQPQIDYERVSLTISGPGGLYWTRSLAPSEPVLFEPVDANGQSLPDGSYVYELRATPRRDGTKPLPLVEELVQGGALLVREGALVIPPPDRVSPRPQEPREAVNFAPKTTVIPDDVCIGDACTPVDEGYPLRLKSDTTQINFTNTAFFFWHRSWSIMANEPVLGDGFYFHDYDAGSYPFMVQGAAPHAALVVSSSGNLGLGTRIPAQVFHAVTGNTPTLRLDQDGTGGLSARTWDLGANHTGLFVKDVTNSSAVPLSVQAGAPTNSLVVSSFGRIGIDTSSPQARLHVNSGEVRFPGGAGGTGLTHFNYNAAGFNYIRGTTILADTGGNVGIGTTSPSSKLHLASGALRIGGHIVGERTISGANTADLEVLTLRNTIVNVDSDNNSTDASFSVSRHSDASQVILVAREDNLVGINLASPSFPLHVGTNSTNGNGAHVTAAGVWTNGSSRLNKDNIRALGADDALAALAQLQPVRYTGKESPDGEEYVGFIAEDVPDLVAMNDRKGLSPMDVVAVLTKVVQEQEKAAEVARQALAEQQELIRKLEARLARLEGQP